MRDNKGQLLLLAVVFLAVTLIVLASAATVFLNVKQNQMKGSLAVEYDNVKEKFGIAMEDKLNKYYNNSTNETKNSTILLSFNETKSSFEQLLVLKGVNFDATMNATDIDDETYSNNSTIAFNVTLSVSSLTESITEIKYFRFEKIDEKFELVP